MKEITKCIWQLQQCVHQGFISSRQCYKKRPGDNKVNQVSTKFVYPGYISPGDNNLFTQGTQFQGNTKRRDHEIIKCI